MFPGSTPNMKPPAGDRLCGAGRPGGAGRPRRRRVKFGIIFANSGPWAYPEFAAAMGELAEGFGSESLWTVGHTVVPAGYGSEYPYSKSGRMPGPAEGPRPDP